MQRWASPMIVFKPLRSIRPQSRGGISLNPQVNWILIFFVTIFDGAEAKAGPEPKASASSFPRPPPPERFFSSAMGALFGFP
jgi:hypothetical protein